MPHASAERDRDVQPRKPIPQDSLDLARIAAVSEVATHHGLGTVKPPGAQQLGQHPIDAARQFCHIFEEHDPPQRGGKISGTHAGGQESEVPADQVTAASPGRIAVNEAPRTSALVRP